MSSQSDLDQPGPPNITVDDLQLAGKRRRQRRASSGLTLFFLNRDLCLTDSKFKWNIYTEI